MTAGLDLPRAAKAAGLVAAPAAAAALSAYQPTAGLALVGLALAVPAAWILHRRVGSSFALVVLVGIGGLITLTRGFAGIYLPAGGAPLYAGELLLMLLLVPAVRRLRGRSYGLPALLLVVWVAFNAALTVPRIGEFGLTAIRDAATWYYALFAIIGAAAWPEITKTTVRRWFALTALISFVVLPASLLAQNGSIPNVSLPLSDAPLLTDKFDTNAMYLLAAAALFITGDGRAEVAWPRWATLWLLVIALAEIVVVQHRSAMVGLIGVLALLVAFRMWRPVLRIVGGGLALVAVLWVLGIEIDTPRGAVSAQTVLERQASTLGFISGDEAARDQDGPGGTVRWRTVWWRALVDQALAAPTLLVVGRGYGPDLRDAVVGLQVGDLNWDQGTEKARPVRSPHSIAMTLFARSGLLGLTIWTLLLGASVGRMVRATAAARRAGRHDDEMFGIWLVATLVAILLVAMLGVVLESPFGGAPFFFLLGIGVAWASDLLGAPPRTATG
jgi:hypothetical protein